MLVFVFVLLPLAAKRWVLACSAWPCLMVTTGIMWVCSIISDPGWTQPATIVRQPDGLSSAECSPTTHIWQMTVEELMLAATEQNAEICKLDVAWKVRLSDQAAAPSDSGSCRHASGRRARLLNLEVMQRRLAQQQQLLAVLSRELQKQTPTSLDPSVVAPSSRSPLPSARSRRHAELLPLVCLGADSGGASDRAELHTAAVPIVLDTGEVASLSAQSLVLSRRVAELLAGERIFALRDDGGSEYVRSVLAGESARICVVCHAVRGMRTFHCKDCGRCVQRLDHHCPWIDNCVGLANQRLFFCFLGAVFSTLVLMFYLCVQVLVRYRVPVKQEPIGEIAAFSALMAICLDSASLAFVASLLVRQTMYMVVNLTTYEALLCPPHVRNRFPRREHRLWFCADAHPRHALQSCHGYWTLDMTHDASDFGIMNTDCDAKGAQPSRCRPTCTGAWNGSYAGLCGGMCEGSSAPHRYVPGRLESTPLADGASSRVASVAASSTSWIQPAAMSRELVPACDFVDVRSPVVGSGIVPAPPERCCAADVQSLRPSTAMPCEARSPQ